ncbi:MAG: SurA N-terminal domain-containing protein [Rubrivivax sp.]|nr:SurA N-terminal domain-containing protein [Rubrivivax sp.]
MFDFFRTHTRWVLGFVVLLIIPSFVFFGVEGYTQFREAGNRKVAEVEGQAITQAEWDAAHQRNIDRLRRQMPNIDVKLLDTPEARKETLEGMMRERVLMAAAQKQHLFPTDQRLQRLFLSDPQFAPLRNADGSVNKDILAAQGMSSEMFAQQLRTDIGVRQVLAGIAATATAPKASVDAAVQAVMQRREVQARLFGAKEFEAKVNPSEADIEAYYKANEGPFRLPEQAEVEYVLLDLEGLKKSLSVSEDELRKYYAENASRYTAAEERRASHILIKADKAAPAPEKQKAKARAEELLAQLRKAPASFADVARKNSEDVGSAERGGDLDFFGRGAMVKPFEDAVFGMKPGEISPVIESDFGYHVIRLDAVRGGEKKPFEAVRAEIDSEVKRQLAQRRYAEAAEQFTNTVYEQADSLQPVVDKLKLDKRTATVLRNPVPGAAGPMSNPKLLEALFSTDSITNKRNTDAVDLGNSQLVSARIVKHQPARLPPIADVRDKVRQAVVRKQAAEMARKEGEALLASITQKPGTPLGGVQVVSRSAGGLPPEVIDAVLRMDADKLPAPVGVSLGEQGYWVGLVQKVLPADPEALANPAIPQQFARAWAAAESEAYYLALKKRHKAELKAPEAAASAAR